MNPYLVVGALVGVGSAVLYGIMRWAGKPRCPTEAQKKMAFDHVKSGELPPEGVKKVAADWEAAGCKAEAAALRAASVAMAKPEDKAKVTDTVKKEEPKHEPVTKDEAPAPLPDPVSNIPGTSIAIPKTFPTRHTLGPAYNCDYTTGGRETAVWVMMSTSGVTKTKDMADALTTFAQQLAFCGAMDDATKIGKRAEEVRGAIAVTGFESARRHHPLHRRRAAR